MTEYTKRKKDEFEENGGIMVPETLMENMNNDTIRCPDWVPFAIAF